MSHAEELFQTVTGMELHSYCKITTTRFRTNFTQLTHLVYRESVATCRGSYRPLEELAGAAVHD